MFRECLLMYISSVSTAAGGRTSLRSACNLILKAIFRDREAAPINAAFSKRDNLADLNGSYADPGTRGMLEGKDVDHLNSLLPHSSAFVDRLLGEEHRYPMNHMHSKVSKLQNRISR